MTQQPDWRRFELAVENFVSAIGSPAIITHDVQLPDIHSGYPRQRDIWIEWSIFGHFPAKALISCKHWATPLDEQDIDHFNGEFISSGAQIGILYSKSGYNRRAIKKAQALGFHCCKLYENEPADIPEVLSLGLAYNFRPVFLININGAIEFYKFKKWHEVLDLPTNSSTVLDRFAEAIDSYQDDSDMKERWARAARGSKTKVRVELADKPPLEIELLIQDRKYKAKLEYTMLEGSYNLTAGTYLGTQYTPPINTQSADPGPGWDEITEIPNFMPMPVIAAYMTGSSRSWLVEFGKTNFQ